MKLWTGLVPVILCLAQAYGQPTQNVSQSQSIGQINSQSPSAYKSSINPRITWSQGFLGFVVISAPNDTILSWDADTVECPGSVASPYFHPKNFGTEAVTLCAPVEPESTYFSRQTDCQCYNSLAPGEMSPCSVQVYFSPSADGTFLDTLRIETNSWNSYGGFVRIPLRGTCVSTPQSPNVVININGIDANLFWNSVHASQGGCPVSVSGYFVFYAPDNNGVYRLLTFTSDTSYVHSGVIMTDGGLFYQVIAGTQFTMQMRGIPRGTTMETVLNELK